VKIGHTNAEIATRLCISPRTVETHRANMMRKLGLRTHTDLIHYALRRGILPMD
jgi:DNA-binding CsgD family transcriptional regulator